MSTPPPPVPTAPSSPSLPTPLPPSTPSAPVPAIAAPAAPPAETANGAASPKTNAADPTVGAAAAASDPPGEGGTEESPHPRGGSVIAGVADDSEPSRPSDAAMRPPLLDGEGNDEAASPSARPGGGDVAEAAAPGPNRPTRAAGEDDGRDVAATQEAEAEAAKRTVHDDDAGRQVNDDGSQSAGSTRPVLETGGCSKEHRGTLAEQASLLSNLFRFASSGEEEDARSDVNNDAPEAVREDCTPEDGADRGLAKGGEEATDGAPRREEVLKGEADARGNVPTNTGLGCSIAAAVPHLPHKKKGKTISNDCIEDVNHKDSLEKGKIEEEAQRVGEGVATINGTACNELQNVDPARPSSLCAGYHKMNSNLLHSTVTSPNETWKSKDKIQSADLLISHNSPTVASTEGSPSMSSYSSLPKKKKKKDRTGHPKLNQVAVEYLRAWMLSKQHIEQPYPTDYVYARLGAATGLEKNQLKNWFVNNRRRLWRPMMTELRQRHRLSERDTLPLNVLDTLEDEPPPPYPHLVVHRPPSDASSNPPFIPFIQLPYEAPGHVVADSAAAAAMIMMNGGSRVNSPSTGKDSKDVKGSVKDQVVNPNGSNDSTLTTVPSTGEKASPRDETKRTPTQRNYYNSAPPGNVPLKEQVKFNVGGTVVQVPTDILLKHERSKIASMARSAMRMGGIAIPIPRDYELFSHCVFYLCNGRVSLPPSIRRKTFMREMNHFGIPYDVGSISGGCASHSHTSAMGAVHNKLRADGQREQFSPTTVTQLHAADGTPTQPQPVTNAVMSAGSLPQKASVTASKLTSPLDLLSSVSSTSSWSSGYVDVHNGTMFSQHQQQTATPANISPAPPPLKRSMCGTCEACRRENCGKCTHCLDKPKFGGPNRLRKKCIKRKCPHMSPHSFIGPANKSAAAAKYSKGALDLLEKWQAQQKDGRRAAGSERYAEERKVAGPNFAILAAEKRWTENLAALRPCIESGGVINYATIDGGDARNRVKNFVKEQRKNYRWRESGESTNMTDERLKLLEEAKFPFVFRPYTKSSKQAVVSPAVPTAKLPTSSLDLLISITSQSIVSDIVDEKYPMQKPTSSLDMLCSITAKAFDEADSSCDGVVKSSESQESSSPISSPNSASPAAAEIASVSQFVKVKVHRPRGPNCGKCEACVRENCGKCKACLDKPKFGGPNTMKRRCFNRYCLCRKQDDRPPQERKVIGDKSYSDAVMKTELAKIKAELDAKAQGMEFGFKVEGELERRPSQSIENLSNEVEKSDGEDEIAENCSQEDKVMESQNVSLSDDLSNAVYKADMATDVSDLPRGVTMRPSGKWQVQLYYAGNSRYIGLFDTRQEAAMAYEMARGCCYSFKEEDPTPVQVKQNLDLMRKAAFSGGDYRHQYYEELKPDDQRRERITTIQQHNPDRSNAVPVNYAKDNDDAATTTSKPERAKSRSQTAHLHAKSSEILEKKLTGRSQSIRAIDVKRKGENKTKNEVMEDVESRKRKLFSSEIYQNAKALADRLPRGITVRPSGKWQVQLYYAGKSRYIGVFNSKLDAAVAYELARDCFSVFRDDVPSPEQAKKNVELMRKAAFSFTKNDTKRTKTNTTKYGVHAERPKKRNAPAAEQQRAARPAKRARKLDDKKPEPKKKPDLRKINEESTLAKPWFDSKSRRTIKVEEEKKGKQVLQINQAAPSAMPITKRSLPMAAMTPSLVELEELAEQEFGSVGWKFHKQFPCGKWYDGVVVKILEDVESGFDRRCHYPADDEIEDFSLAGLRKLAKLEVNMGEREDRTVKHNDLCETCGKVGELLCCSTCNLVFHLGCTRPKLTELPSDDWSCAFCISSGDVGRNMSRQVQQKARLAVKEIEVLKENVKKKQESRRRSPRKKNPSR